jgi:hypothetical protein
MSNDPTKSAAALERIFDLIEDELMRTSGRDLDEMVESWGVDPSRSKQSIEAAFKAALRSQNKQRLADAKRAAEVEVAKLHGAAGSMPGTREDLLNKIASLLADRRATDPKSVTLGHRNLSEYTEEDLRSLLNQLSTLG